MKNTLLALLSLLAFAPSCGQGPETAATTTTTAALEDDAAAAPLSWVCGRSAPFNYIQHCGTYNEPLADGVIACGPCPDPAQQCGATIIEDQSWSHGTVWQQPNTCFLSCASQGVTCGSMTAYSTLLGQQRGLDEFGTITCGPACP